MAVPKKVSLQKWLRILHTITIGLLLTAAAFFGFGSNYSHSNNFTRGQSCPLYYSATNHSSILPCIFAIGGEVLAAVGLIVLIVIIILKMTSVIKETKGIWIGEIAILVVSITFAVSAAIVLSSGWGITCQSLKQLNIECNVNVLRLITASTVLAGLALLMLVLSSILTILTIQLAYKENSS